MVRTGPAIEMTTEEEGHQTKFYFLRSLSDTASTETHMVLSGHQSLEIRDLVSQPYAKSNIALST